MILQVGMLPSKGDGYKITSFVLHPLTYRQLIDYSKDPAETPLQRLKRDIVYLLSDIEGYKDFNVYDMKAIIFARKCLSISLKDVITTEIINPKTGKLFKIKLNVGEIDFAPVSDEIKKIEKVVVGEVERQLKYPVTIGEFEEVLDTYAKFDPNVDIRIVYLSTMFGFLQNPNEIGNAINNSTHEDIRLLETLYLYLSGATQDQRVQLPEGGDVRVSFDNLVVDLFRTLLENQKFSSEKIITKQVL